MAARLKHIEVARGITIMLVVLGHNVLFAYGSPQSYVLHSINLPMFLLISGAFFKAATPFWPLLADKTDRLLKPYFVTCLLITPLVSLPASRHLLGMLYGTGWTLLWIPLWFLPHLWLVSILAKAWLEFVAYIRLSRGIQISLALLSLGTAFLVLKLLYYAPLPFYGVKTDMTMPLLGYLGLPFSADLLLITLPFFLTGHALREHLCNFSHNTLVLLPALLVFVFLHHIGHGELNLNARVFQNPLINLGETISGVYVAFTLANWISLHSVWLRNFCEKAGQSSLFILLLHWPLQNVVYTWLRAAGAAYIPAAIAACGIGVLLPLLLYQVTLRLPWLAMWWLPLKQVKVVTPTATATSTTTIAAERPSE